MEQFISDLKNTAKTAAKKTGELLEIGKLKIACSDTKTKINEAYKELGKALYNAEKEGNADTEVMGKIVEEIDTLYEQLTCQEEQLASLKNQKKCSSCGAICDEESIFCLKCGEKF